MFSTCSELTPRAPIPDGRMAQFMQPCPLSGVLEVTRSLLDSDHGEEALLESYTRILHEIGLEL